MAASKKDVCHFGIECKKMNTSQIDAILSSKCDLSTKYAGTFACDHLPRAVDKPAALVVNTDPAHMPGTHWVCIYIENDRGEYFDSYGLPPTGDYFTNFLRNNCKKWIWNKKQLQSLDSTVCGQWCISFLTARGRGEGMEKFQQKFCENLEKNDSKISHFDKIETAAKILDQSCRSSHHGNNAANICR